MTDTTKDPGVILHEAIFICGDCPECGSDNWTHDEEHGVCHSCGARFSPTIPLQMLKSREALTSLLAERDRYRNALSRIHQAYEDDKRHAVILAEIAAEALGLPTEPPTY